ncbi:MAG: glucosaminidase domain-containing protein, partial [Acidimicrobiales bacterium]|nr:glucosaminidase domain-containing protein [Acidimicrobiales bacterium]
STRANERRVRAEQAHAEAVAEAEAADLRLRTAANDPIVPVPEEVPIIGLPRLTGEDLATWFASSPYRPRVATPIEDYADWFIEEGMTEGIRGDIAFAQAVLETGGFTNTDSVEGHNFSGIGHYDNLARGWTFPSPRLGVRAQIQLLKSYAVRTPDYANELVDRRLRGPAGCCETWGDLTTVWATDPTYGPKVMLIYTSIVEHALARRARGEGFEDPTAEPTP